ncbi:DUF1801 domain-containing protein [Glycomyces sp. TRM65418]|uniref:DUF1801 domain-containing protein n=1 Tax=Glycomyces sp. TRM65418 TaxID=2867006 RepID=UPI001CE6669C|nr:DUF1801 domain-containing protein [Glycomyces sp. TRM65418]MCC3763395.1 DUF1801 domain-containing protein [Glycomyces sp. TRM65418]QZD57387.1 DUF1801 domain-containing protein [Glycomyces sp. TRM65418]
MSSTSKAGEQQRGDTSGEGFSAEERASMKARAKELKNTSRGGEKAAANEEAVRSTIAKMAEPDRALAERVHEIVGAAAPELAPKLWYGQPAYERGGKVVCFFRSGKGDKERYSSFGFTAEANLDDDSGIWPTSYALTDLTDAGEAALRKLVKKAVS